MQTDIWPGYFRALLASSVASAAVRFPGRGDEAPESVHRVRKILKESRALARLFLPNVGEPARVTIAALAVVRRRVGRARDLDVMESRLARLAPPPEIAGPLQEAIRRERAAAKRAHTGFATAASRTQLNAIVKRLEGWDLRNVKDTDVAEAVARTYRQGLRRGRGAFDGGDPTALHGLRSRVVDLRYQLSALSRAWPAALGALSEELNALRDTLGDFNDLDVLRRFATDCGGLSSEALAGLTERLEIKQSKLKHRAGIEFERLFAETAGAFAARLEVYLRHPMDGPAPRLCGVTKPAQLRSSARPSKDPPGVAPQGKRSGGQKSTANPLTSQSP
jgi:CHAD domain-containing protein